MTLKTSKDKGSDAQHCPLPSQNDTTGQDREARVAEKGRASGYVQHSHLKMQQQLYRDGPEDTCDADDNQQRAQFLFLQTTAQCAISGNHTAKINTRC